MDNDTMRNFQQKKLDFRKTEARFLKVFQHLHQPSNEQIESTVWNCNI